jgi:anti-sigma factor (TIGR02949 family)
MMDKHPGSCRHLLNSLSDFVDGDLAQDICAEIERHLSECENCHVVVDSLRKTISLYRSCSQDPEIPSEVRARLYHRLHLEEFLEK